MNELQYGLTVWGIGALAFLGVLIGGWRIADWWQRRHAPQDDLGW